MNKNEVIKEIALKRGISVESTKGILNDFIELIGDKMEQREKVQVSGFGTFKARFINEKIIRNPSTGEKVVVPAHYAPRFVPAKRLKKKIG